MTSPQPFRLGVFAGAPILVQPEGCVVLLCVAFPVIFRDPIAGLVLAAALFGSILAHEIGHACAARRYGLRVERIRHIGIAGLCVFEDPGPDAQRRCAIAVAGPVANILIAAVFLPLAVGLDQHERTGGIVAAIVTINVTLCVGNLLPAFPLDGSHILTEVLATRWSRRRAVLATSICGVALAGPLLLFSLVFALAGYPVVIAALLSRNWRILREVWHDGRSGQVTDWDGSPPSPLDEADRLMAALLREQSRRNAIRRTQT